MIAISMIDIMYACPAEVNHQIARVLSYKFVAYLGGGHAPVWTAGFIPRRALAPQVAQKRG